MQLVSKFHAIKIDIGKVNFRICKIFQENIIDSYEDGKLKYEWDVVKESYILDRNMVIFEICKVCPVNVYHNIMGCEGIIPYLPAFLNLIKMSVKDSFIHKLNYNDLSLNELETRQFYDEINRIKPIIQDLMWPVAQVFVDNVAPTVPVDDTTHSYCFIPWDGEEDSSCLFGNDVYYIGRNFEGIMVATSLEDSSPYILTKLINDGTAIYGITTENETLEFEPIDGLYPAWDNFYDGNSELRATKLPALEVFADTIKTIALFCQVGQYNSTGIRISLM